MKINGLDSGGQYLSNQSNIQKGGRFAGIHGNTAVARPPAQQSVGQREYSYDKWRPISSANAAGGRHRLLTAPPLRREIPAGANTRGDG
jgi:hypothetical protein